jgi:hypothetical protein
MVTIEPENSDGIVVGVACGELTLKEMHESASAIWREYAGKRARVLWDLRDARFSLTADEVQKMAEFMKQQSPVADLRMAFLVTSDLEFGLIRMFGVFRESQHAKTAVFRDIKQATWWLKREIT